MNTSPSENKTRTTIFSNLFLTTGNTTQVLNTSNSLSTVKEGSPIPKEIPSHNIFDELKLFMQKKIDQKKTKPSPKLKKNTTIVNSHVEKYFYSKYKINSKDNFNKFEDKMKVFQELDSYIDIKEYLKKVNLSYNPHMKDILKQRKKYALRKEFSESFGVDVNELESPQHFITEINDFASYFNQTEHEDLVLRAKNQIKTRRKNRNSIDFVEKNKIQGELIETQLKSYLKKDLIEKSTIQMDEEDINSETKVFDKIEEIYKAKQPGERILKKLSTLRKFREDCLDSPRKTQNIQEMEKFQTLIENSIDFNIIKNCKNDEEDIPSNFYYMAYKTHTQKIESILKKTCMKLYSKKLNSISTNTAKLSDRIKEETQKLKNAINIKLAQKKVLLFK